jgi:hypothetical protein
VGWPMTIDPILQAKLASYIDTKRRARQVHLAVGLAELLGDAASRHWAEQIAENERKSSDFLSSRLRELSR